MKVLEEGKWKMVWSAEMVCSEKSCEAKLLVEEADVKAVDYSSSRNDFYAVCAVCGANMNVAASALPLRMKKELNAKRKYSSSSSWD